MTNARCIDTAMNKWTVDLSRLSSLFNAVNRGVKIKSGITCALNKFKGTSYLTASEMRLFYIRILVIAVMRVKSAIERFRFE